VKLSVTKPGMIIGTNRGTGARPDGITPGSERVRLVHVGRAAGPAAGVVTTCNDGEGPIPHPVPELGRPQEGYPEEWPWVARAIKCMAGWRCEHCGGHFPPGGIGEDVLTVHHLDGDRGNLQSWNLIALCLRDHAFVQRWVDLDVDQLSLFGITFPWLEQRRAERALYPYRNGTDGEGESEGNSLNVNRTRPSGIEVCACGCGRTVTPSRRGQRRLYATRACRQRAYRDRHADQISLLPLVAPAGQ
jgi:hypothetical protein